MLELSISNLFRLTGSDPYSQTLVALVALIAVVLALRRWRV